MSKLNKDILYSIFEEFKDDKKSLHSCLSVNKTWCRIIIPILWKNPWKYLRREKSKLLLGVIISHLSSQSKNNLENQGFNFLMNSSSYQRPLFDYISFCKHLNLDGIQRLLRMVNNTKIEEKISIIKNEIITLFINKNTKFTHLHIPHKFDFQIHLVPGAEHSLSKLEFLHCSTNINENFLIWLKICKSIKEIELIIEGTNNNYEIVKLIQSQKKLINVHYIVMGNETFCILENSFLKHANIIQYFKLNKPLNTKILSSFVNLKILELDGNYNEWNCLENLTLPHLQILRARSIPIKSLISLIENTKGYLIEIKIDYISHDDIYNKRIIRAIHQNCPYLKYLKILLRNNNILEFENLLINCQDLNGLYILISNVTNVDYLFEILTKSSPNNLFKFKFGPDGWNPKSIKLESLKIFFENWNGRHPILLQTIQMLNMDMNNLIEKYKVKGLVKKHDNDWYGTTFEDFEWIQKKI